MWELDYKESWAPKNWCFWTVVLEKTLESPLDCKEIPPVHPKRDQSWIFTGRTDAEAETLILWPLMWRADSLKKILMLGNTEGIEKGEDRGWDGWMVSPTQWTWVWVVSGSWWWTGKPDVQQSMVSQSQTGLSNWTELNWGLPRQNRGREFACQCRWRKRREFNPWVRKIPWRRKWQPTPVFLPGESHGQRCLEGYCPWGCRVRHYWETHTHAGTFPCFLFILPVSSYLVISFSLSLSLSHTHTHTCNAGICWLTEF